MIPVNTVGALRPPARPAPGPLAARLVAEAVDSFVRVAEKPPDYRFALRYTREQLLNDAAEAASFVKDYLDRESVYFAVARHPMSQLTLDGLRLDPTSGLPVAFRNWSAPSKECLDLGIYVKALGGDRRAQAFLSPADPARAVEKAAHVLQGKLASYREFQEENPGYGGYLPWFMAGDRLAPTRDWDGEIPGLDNGEWVWSMLLAEKALRKAGQTELADGYRAYNAMLRKNAVPVFYDAQAGKVRADVRVTDPKSADSRYETIHGKPGRMTHLTGEHGVHEGCMLVHYLTLFGEGLPGGAADRIWKGIEMERVEHDRGTTWEAFWGSSHESWAYLFLPFRDDARYADLFRIREKIRTQNAADRGYPGLATSTNDPLGEGYLDGAGIEGIGSQAIRNNHTYAIYGAFPLLMQFAAGPPTGNVALAWLHNMLLAQQMQGPLGGGESGTNDGKAVSNLKTIDGSLPNVLALMGGLEKESAAMLREEGLYDAFRARIGSEYREAFGRRPLREPAGFALPTVTIPRDGMPDYR